MANVDTLSARRIATGIAAGDFSAVEVARASLGAIDARDADTQAFLQVSEDLALKAAARTDAARAAGEHHLSELRVGARDWHEREHRDDDDDVVEDWAYRRP